MKRKSCRVQPFHKKSHTILFYASMFLFTLILILPFIYVVDASFQNEWAIKIGAVKVFPAAVTLQNYKDLLLESVGVTAFRENLFNSIKISFGVTTLSVVIGVLGAYGLSRYGQLGEVLVNPGDFIFADADGVLVIPNDMIEKVLINAKERAANEIKTKADIKAGKTPEEMWYEDGHSGVLDEDK